MALSSQLKAQCGNRNALLLRVHLWPLHRERNENYLNFYTPLISIKFIIRVNLHHGII